MSDHLICSHGCQTCVDAAIADERERCARICEEYEDNIYKHAHKFSPWEELAARIRQGEPGNPSGEGGA